MLLKAPTEETVLQFSLSLSQIFTSIGSDIFRFIKFLPVLYAPYVPGVQGVEELYPWNWSSTRLKSKPRSCARATSGLNQWALIQLWNVLSLELYTLNSQNTTSPIWKCTLIHSLVDWTRIQVLIVFCFSFNKSSYPKRYLNTAQQIVTSIGIFEMCKIGHRLNTLTVKCNILHMLLSVQILFEFKAVKFKHMFRDKHMLIFLPNRTDSALLAKLPISRFST